jgi:hypothetical protein
LSAFQAEVGLLDVQVGERRNLDLEVWKDV